MCKAKPSVNNGEDVASSNTAIGLVNFSAEEWSFSKPHHRTEIVSIMIFIILIAFGLYKLRQRCIKKRNNNQQTNTAPYAPAPYAPNQPPTYARDHPHDPTYHPPRPAYATWYSGNFEQKRHRRLNVRKKWNQTYRKPCVPQDVSIHTHLLNINIVSFYILYYDIGHPQHNLKRNSNLILFYLSNSFHHFWTINMNKKQGNKPFKLSSILHFINPWKLHCTKMPEDKI